MCSNKLQRIVQASVVTSSDTGKNSTQVEASVTKPHNQHMDTRTLQARLKQLISQMVDLLEAVDPLGETPEMVEAKKRADSGRCCYCGEEHGDDIIYRGDHQKCYKRVWRVIQAKEITEEQAVRRGWFLPSDPGGRKADPNDPISKYLLEKEEPKATKPPKARKK